MQWQRLVTRKYPVLQGYSWIWGIRLNMANILGQTYNYALFITEGDAQTLYFTQEELQQMAGRLIGRIKQDPNFVTEHSNDCYQLGSQLLEITRKTAEQSHSSIDNKELAIRFKKVMKAYWELAPFMNTPFVVEQFITSAIKETLTKLAKESSTKLDVDSTFAKLAIPNKESLTLSEARDLLILADKVRKSPKILMHFQNNIDASEIEAKIQQIDIYQAIIKHLDRYKWLSTDSMYGEPWNLDYIITILRELVTGKRSPEEKLGGIEEKTKAQRKELKEILNTLKPSPELQGLIDTLREYMYLKSFRKETYCQAHTHIRSLLQEIASRANINYAEVVSMTPTEIIEFLENGELTPIINLQARIKSYATYMKEGELSVYSGPDTVQALHFSLLGDFKTEERLKLHGMPAFPGIAEGIARVLLDVSEFNRMHAGDILVTRMTTPDFVPVMRKASAIVTDEGGITCHAAIVSRELGIPCIVGTQNATSVIKDGQVIEVNAELGSINLR